MQVPQISISVVSHLQAKLVSGLLADLQKHCVSRSIEVLLTVNLPEQMPFGEGDFSFPVKLIKNASPMGFGANHNQAFAASSGTYFCVVNPDITFGQDPFGPLLTMLDAPEIGVIAPRIVNVEGFLEDSARYFPTPIEIIGKVFGRASLKYSGDGLVGFPDWVGGMFMVFRRDVFRELHGFDTRYFMYYEDVDLCARLTLNGYRVALCSSVSVIHDARRASHASLRYLKWHLTSMLRFFLSPHYRKLRGKRIK